MSKIFDTSMVGDDDAHWDALADRIAAQAAGRSKANGFEWLGSSRASWIAVSLFLVSATAVMLSTSNDLMAKKARVEWERALAPTDNVGMTVILNDVPPAIGLLLLGGRGGG